ncbi:hypothetical protein jhhlp_000387 [Lomentospora prolificans]|uniref:VPS4-associated protein 1 n=1 Tax=Lomentospora prolificans TaxID=41688 RepID=A0A2N3NKP8_9PEZI|nr:hypothetical protein jhhlp_000387 [Lomentospora prolificans]
MQFPNVYAHRKVAETASKGCDICYRPTTSVLLAEGPDGKDFFYVCVSHLKDRNFCSPIIDQAALDAKKQKELEEEVERVKKEYEEKKKKKDEEKKKKKEEEDKDKDEGSKDKNKNKDKDEDKKGKSDDIKPEESPTQTAAEEPRVFALHRTFYQQRVQKRRQMEMAKRNRERLQQPSNFPSVPKGLPGA